MNISKYLEYASGLGASNKVISWINHNLENHLEKHQEDQTEIEHIIDFLISDKCPIRLDKVSYKQAKEKTDLWVKELNKQAEKIIESDQDTEVTLDFKDGFKFVKLVGKNAFDREGLLMSSCVASYYGRDTNIYSLRDKENKPHCTIEENQQIKGKGNSSIHPKYIKYVVEFLEFLGMEVSDNEMANLGYVNISDVKDKEAVFTDLFRKKYFYKGNKILDKEGKEYHNMTLWDKFNIFDLDLKLNINWNFDIALSVKTFIASLKNYKSNNLKKDYSVSTNTGYRSASTNTGDRSASTNTGDYSASTNTGYQGKSSVDKDTSIAISTGREGVAKGKIGSWIVLVERDEEWNIIGVKSVMIDGKKLKENTWYKLENKKFVEANDN